MLVNFKRQENIINIANPGSRREGEAFSKHKR
jgi:hypothetical protein